MATETEESVVQMKPLAVFGFDGKVYGGLNVHPDKKHFVFPLGNSISIVNFETNEQEFLSGHTNTVSTIQISSKGSYVGSGQLNHMGFRAYTIIWDWAKRAEIVRHELHKVKVETLCFTSDEMFLITMGGRDCGRIVVWNIEAKAAICSFVATKQTTGMAKSLMQLNRRTMFVSAGDQNIRLWGIKRDAKQVSCSDVAVGKLRREYTTIRIDARDDLMFLGTTSGDIVKIKLNCNSNCDVTESDRTPVLLGCFACHVPRKPVGKDCEKYVNGVRNLWILEDGKLIIGAGDGTIDLVVERNIKTMKGYPSPTWPMLTSIRRTKINGTVSSFQLIDADTLLIGTESCEIFSLRLASFETKLLRTCPTSAVYDLAFPHDFSHVFATASVGSIRIWSLSQLRELLRIVVPGGYACSSVAFTNDGKKILSGWNDGVLRAFTPITGALIFAIPNAHNKGVSALCISSCGKILISGGCEGQVRLWQIEAKHQKLIGVLKEHAGPIATVDLNKSNTEIISSSNDGTCIIWDVKRLSRKHVLFVNSQFSCARYYPSGVQILTAGSDRRIRYWETFDASLVRNLVGSTKGAVNCLSLSTDGKMFASVSNDQSVKLWDYEAGETIAIGNKHAAVVICCRISPCNRYLVSGSADGGVIVWQIPREILDNFVHKDDSATHRQSDNGVDKHDELIHELESARSLKDLKISQCPAIECCVGFEKIPAFHLRPSC